MKLQVGLNATFHPISWCLVIVSHSTNGKVIESKNLNNWRISTITRQTEPRSIGKEAQIIEYYDGINSWNVAFNGRLRMERNNQVLIQLDNNNNIFFCVWKKKKKKEREWLKNWTMSLNLLVVICKFVGKYCTSCDLRLAVKPKRYLFSLHIVMLFQ